MAGQDELDPRILDHLRSRASGYPPDDLAGRIVRRAVVTPQDTVRGRAMALGFRGVLAIGVLAAALALVVSLLSTMLLLGSPNPPVATPRTAAPASLTTTPTDRPASYPTWNPVRPTPPQSCPVTVPSPPLVPPSPFPSAYPTLQGGSQYAWYGTSALWTALDTRGDVWWALPHTELGLTNKTFWYSASYSVMLEPVPDIVVTGVNLSTGETFQGEQPATNAISESGQSMLVGVDVPRTGCWALTATYRSTALTYVVWVVD